MRSRRARLLGSPACAGVVGAVAAGAVSCRSVTPVVEFSTWEFEGFEVVSSVPEDPKGLAKADAVVLPASVRADRSEVLNQYAVVVAIHQMRGDVKDPVGDFFDTHLGREAFVGLNRRGRSVRPGGRCSRRRGPPGPGGRAGASARTAPRGPEAS